ncbi:hypothetical protein GQX74_010428 [Glossina fuscipes]|nr:hypothetical protein GQX74_010428 [Glossina fuscipes]
MASSRVHRWRSSPFLRQFQWDVEYRCYSHPPIVDFAMLSENRMVCYNICICNKKGNETNRKIFRGIHCLDHKQANDVNDIAAHNDSLRDNTFACVRACISPNGILSPIISDLAVVIVGVGLAVVVAFTVVAVVDKLILLSVVELVEVLPGSISANCGDSTMCMLSPVLNSPLTEVYLNASYTLFAAVSPLRSTIIVVISSSLLSKDSFVVISRFSFKSLETVVDSYLLSLTSLAGPLSIVGALEDVLNVVVTFSKS